MMSLISTEIDCAALASAEVETATQVGYTVIVGMNGSGVWRYAIIRQSARYVNWIMVETGDFANLGKSPVLLSYLCTDDERLVWRKLDGLKMHTTLSVREISHLGF